MNFEDFIFYYMPFFAVMQAIFAILSLYSSFSLLSSLILSCAVYVRHSTPSNDENKFLYRKNRAERKEPGTGKAVSGSFMTPPSFGDYRGISFPQFSQNAASFKFCAPQKGQNFLTDASA